MIDPYNNPLVNDIRKMMLSSDLAEATTNILLPTKSNRALNYIDIEDPDNPIVVAKGLGTISLSKMHSNVANRLQQLANDVARGYRTGTHLVAQLGVIGTDRVHVDVTASWITAWAEAEETMIHPQNKAKISKRKKILKDAESSSAWAKDPRNPNNKPMA